MEDAASCPASTIAWYLIGFHCHWIMVIVVMQVCSAERGPGGGRAAVLPVPWLGL